MTSPGPYPPHGWQPPPPGWQPPPPPGWQPPPGWYPPAPAWQQPPGWYPPAPVWRPKPPKPLPHDVPQPFLHVMRARSWGWWRPLLGILFFAAVYAIASILSTLVVFVALLPTGTTWI